MSDADNGGGQGSSARQESAPDPRSVLCGINRAHDTHFTLASRLPGGATNAWLLRAVDGRPAVLKTDAGSLDRLQAAAHAVERLRAHGFPTPRWLLVGQLDAGTTFHIQEFVKGNLVQRPTVALAREVVSLIERNADADLWPGRDLSTAALGTITGAVAVLGNCSPEIRSVVDRYEGIVTDLALPALPSGEFVHGDLHWGNLLIHHGKISGVIDIESGGSGTRVLDYARLLRDTYFPHRVPEPGVREIIRMAGETVAGPAVLAVCAAAAVLDNLGWRVQVRHPRTSQLIPAFLDLADDLERSCT